MAEGYIIDLWLPRGTYKIVDLSMPLSPSMHGYPGDPELTTCRVFKAEEGGWNHNATYLPDHAGIPHVDAPLHFIPNGKSIDIFSHFFGEANLLDLEGVVEIEKSHLEKYEHSIHCVEAILIKTGYGKRIEKNEPHDVDKLPHLTPEAASYLAGFSNLRVVGIDSLTVGSKEAHLALQDKIILEKLVHLDRIPKRRELVGFYLQLKPIVIESATGAVCAAFAWYPIED